MKLLGFHGDHARLAVPTPATPAAGGLRAADPARYLELVRALTEGDPHQDTLRAALRDPACVVIVTGQQPALLGGPLYTLYKAMTAAEQARRIRANGGVAVAAFWCVGDDTDVDEVRHAAWPQRNGSLRRVRVEADTGAAAERIGGLPVEAMRPALAALAEDHPGAAGLTVLEEVVARSGDGDWSQFLRRSLAALMPHDPLLFVDGNAGPVVTSAQDFLRGFVDVRRTLAEDLAREAERARSRGGEPPIGREEALRCLFVLEGKGRRVLDAEATPFMGDTLAPNVVLRPALQEHLLPVGLVVCGAAEIAYRRLLGPVYARIGRPAAPLAPRFSATILPPPWASGAPDPAAAATDPEALLDRWSAQLLPPGLAGLLQDTRAGARSSLSALEGPLRELDRSLPQLLDSVAGKVDFQLGRVEEGVRAKARQLLFRTDPALAHLREFVRPRGGPQERTFTFWAPLLWEGAAAALEIAASVRAWLDDTEGRGHALLAAERWEVRS